ncbi:MAG: hypothetical protein ABH878_06155, partial [bacterium]
MSYGRALSTMAVLLCLIQSLIAIRVVSALEGYYTEEEVRSFREGAPERVFIRKSWYAADCMRKEEAWMGTTIARFDRDCIYILDAKSQSYFEVAPEFLQQHSKAGLLSLGAQIDQQGNYYFP